MSKPKIQDLHGIQAARQDKIIAYLKERPLIKINVLVKATGVNMLKQVLAGVKYARLQPEQMDKIEAVLKEYGYKL